MKCACSWAEDGELSNEGRKVRFSDFLVELLGQKVNVDLVDRSYLPDLEQVKLSKRLVRERARHHGG